ncbi:MAG: hypothetical protein LBQ52_10425 [Helicobacteraceae bacterium]|jgi:hypothetical protein|nr:hypothetical protein [Helicobacteraceae bacterium]
MNRAEAYELLKGFLKAGVDCAIIGEAQSGKTALARSLAPAAPILRASEVSNEYLGAIRSLLIDADIAIIENAAKENALFLEELLSVRAILGTPFECRFIITSRQNLTIDAIATINLDAIAPQEWLKWARSAHIHPALISLAADDPAFLSRHHFRSIEALSRVLSARPSIKTLEATIGSILGDDLAARSTLAEFIAAPIESLEHIRASTDENAKAYESAFIERLKTKPKLEDCQRFARHVASLAQSEPKEALELLKELLKSQKAAEALETTLKEPSVQKMIDKTIQEIS